MNRARRLTTVLVVGLSLLGAWAATAFEALTVKPVSIQDGDSFVARAGDGELLRIRIAGIDAPEKGQPYADVARQHLHDLIDGQTLRIEVIKDDPYGRKVANVYVGERDIGLEQLDAGLAWHFKRYAADQQGPQRRAYARAEQRARDDRVGMWREANPVEPWRYRRTERSQGR